MEVALVDQGYTGEKPAEEAAAHRAMGCRKVIRVGARFRRLARDYERLASSLAGLNWLAFATLLLRSLFQSA